MTWRTDTPPTPRYAAVGVPWSRTWLQAWWDGREWRSGGRPLPGVRGWFDVPEPPAEWRQSEMERVYGRELCKS